jgi:pyruvate ferredoxin oxidoreductase beta subunit
MARLAVESRTFPLLECDHGTWRLTYRPRHAVPVSEFLARQGRFAHLTAAEAETIQRHVDERWEQLVALDPAL